MYTLRVIKETRANNTMAFERVIENFELGSSYTVLEKNYTSEFSDLIKKKHIPENRVGEKKKKIVCGGNENSFLLFENSENKQYFYFIMSDSGTTFEKL